MKYQNSSCCHQMTDYKTMQAMKNYDDEYEGCMDEAIKNDGMGLRPMMRKNNKKEAMSAYEKDGKK